MIEKNRHFIGNEYNFYVKIENELNLVIDAGARNSFFTDLDCEVHYFEPDTIGYETIKTKKPNHYINKLGLGSNTTKKILYNDSGSAYRREHDLVNLSNFEEINIISLDDYVESKNIKEISLLKIDVEGMEYEVLCGSKKILNKTKYVVFEYSWDTAKAAGTSFDKIKSILKNFKLYEMNYDGSLRDIDEQSICAEVYSNTNNIVAKNNLYNV
jgi:FkbM family methyltransferase